MSKVPFSDFLNAISDNGESKLQPMSPLKAMADPRRHALLRQLQRTLSRAGYSLDLDSNVPVKVYEIDRALRASADVTLSDPEARMAIKSQLFAAGLIPA